MCFNFVTDNPESWPDEYEGTAQTVERLRICRRDVRKYEVCSRIPARKPADSMRPEFELYSFSAAKEGTRALHRLFALDCDYVKHGSYFHQLRRRPPSKTRLARSLFVREGAVIQLWEFETGNTKFATVLHIRRWLLLLPLLLADSAPVPNAHVLRFWLDLARLFIGHDGHGWRYDQARHFG